MKLAPADTSKPGPYCGSPDIHSAHELCPGLRPEGWVEVGCSNPQCPRTVWVPPDIGAPDADSPVRAVCSTGCAVALVETYSQND